MELGTVTFNELKKKFSACLPRVFADYMIYVRFKTSPEKMAMGVFKIY